MTNTLKRITHGTRSRFNRPKVREYKFARTASPYFAPVGSAFPYKGYPVDTREKALANLAYLRKELGRWDRSTAWVNDRNTTLDSELEQVNKLWPIVEKVLDDSNASKLNEALVIFLRRLAPIARCIMRDFSARTELLAILMLGLAEACEKVDPYCKDTKDLADVRILIIHAKRVLTTLRHTNVGREIPWTNEEIDEYEKAEKRRFLGPDGV